MGIALASIQEHLAFPIRFIRKHRAMIFISLIAILLVLAAVFASIYTPALLGVLGKKGNDPYNEPLKDVAPHEHHQDKASSGRPDGR